MVSQMRTDQADHLCRVGSIFQEIADMVGRDIQAFQVHLDPGLLSESRTLLKVAEHGAELDSVGKVVIRIDDDTAVAKTVGMNGHTGRTEELCCLAGFLEVLHISFCLIGIDQGKVSVSVESADRDSSLLGCLFDSVEIFFGPAPELNRVKPIILCRLETIQERDFPIQSINTSRSLHTKPPFNL